MDWKILSDKVYFLDGSLRDIYVGNINTNDWETWIDFINDNYPIEFTFEGASEVLKRIDKNVIRSRWNSKEKIALNCAIRVGNIIVKCYFFDQDEIENDIAPKEIKTIEDHNNLMLYLKNVSELLDKPVNLCEEGSGEDRKKLIVVDGENISLTTGK